MILVWIFVLLFFPQNGRMPWYSKISFLFISKRKKVCHHHIPIIWFWPKFWQNFSAYKIGSNLFDDFWFKNHPQSSICPATSEVYFWLCHASMIEPLCERCLIVSGFTLPARRFSRFFLPAFKHANYSFLPDALQKKFNNHSKSFAFDI